MTFLTVAQHGLVRPVDDVLDVSKINMGAGKLLYAAVC